MITKLKRRFKLAAIKRQRHQHKTRLLIQSLEDTTRRMEALAAREREVINKLNKRYNTTVQ